MISYKPFFKTMKAKGISQYQLEMKYKISKGTLDSLRNDRNMNLLTIDYLCNLLDIEPHEIFEIIKDKK